MPATPEEKATARQYLGYPMTTSLVAMSFGLPALIGFSQLVDTALNNLVELGLPRFRFLLQTLSTIENRQAKGDRYVIAKQLGELQLNENVLTDLEELYVEWANKLADHLGVPLWPYAERFRGKGRKRGINRKVRR